MIKVKCETCKKVFKRFPCDIKNRTFCSRKCYLKSHKAARLKCDYCGKFFIRSNYHLKWKKHFCSNSCRGEWLSENIRREKHPNWKGGYSVKDYYKFSRQRKRKVRERDNYTCQLCKKKFKTLDVYHLDNNKKNFKLNNLVSLCHSCHGKVRNIPQHQLLTKMKHI